MKPKALAISIAITLLATPGILAAQVSESHKGHHRYKLIDAGTFGGPTGYVAQDLLSTGSSSGVLNNRGMLVGAADTSTPDPDYLPGSGFFPVDPLIMHAFQWQKGVLTDLGALPGNNNSFATWISANGLIAGFSENGVIDPQFNVPQVDAVLWKGGEIIDLGGYFSSAAAVNNRGQVVGNTLNTATLPALNVRAFLWQTGTMRDLGTLGGDQAFAYFVNERGQVAGYSYTNSTPNPTQDPFLWENGTMQDLGTLGGTFGVPNALNNRGQVVGQSNLTGDASFHPFLWEKKNSPQLTDLGTLGGNFGSAFWINDAGEVVGWATAPRDQTAQAFLWKNGVMTNLGTVNGQPCAFAQNVNSKRQVVGVAFDCVTPGGHAWLWENGGPIIDLNTLVPSGSSLTLELAENINDRGEISGIGSPPGCGDPFVCGHAFVLIPCDEEHSHEEGCEKYAAGTTAIRNNPASVIASPTGQTGVSLAPRNLRIRFAPDSAGIAASQLGCKNRFVEHLSEPQPKMTPADQSHPPNEAPNGTAQPSQVRVTLATRHSAVRRVPSRFDPQLTAHTEQKSTIARLPCRLDRWKMRDELDRSSRAAIPRRILSPSGSHLHGRSLFGRAGV